MERACVPDPLPAGHSFGSPVHQATDSGCGIEGSLPGLCYATVSGFKAIPIQNHRVVQVIALAQAQAPPSEAHTLAIDLRVAFEWALRAYLILSFLATVSAVRFIKRMTAAAQTAAQVKME